MDSQYTVCVFHLNNGVIYDAAKRQETNSFAGRGQQAQ